MKSKTEYLVIAETLPALAMVLALSRFPLALSGRAEICVERKLQRDPERQTRRDVRQMRTRTRTDAESARRAESENLLSYDRTVRNDREVIGKNLVFRLSIQREYRTAGWISPPWNIAATLNPALWRLFPFGCFVGRFIGDKTISSRNRKSAISDGITAIMAQPR